MCLIGMQTTGTVRIKKSHNNCSRCHQPTNTALVMMGNNYDVCWKCHQVWHKEYYQKLPKPVNPKQYNQFLEMFKNFEPVHEPFVFR